MEEEKRSFPKIEFILIACVIAMFVFIAVLAAFPQGMKLSPSYEVFFESHKNAFIVGDSCVSGKIEGMCIMKNISSFQCNNVSEVEINGRKFTDTNVSINGGDGEMEVDGEIFLSSFAVFLFNATEKNMSSMACENFSFNASSITAILKNASINIDEKRWEGTHSVSLKGEFQATFKTDIFIFPPNGISLSFKEGKKSDCEILKKFLEEEEIELPPLPFLINGLFFSDEGNISVNEEDFDSNFTIMRGKGNVFFGDTCSLHGTMRLIFANGEFYSKEETNLLPFIPDKLLIFWPLAIGVWIGIPFLEKKFGRKFERYDKELGGIALVIHLFFIFTSFYLWDKEIEHQFGKSVISAIISLLKGSFAAGDWVIAPFEFIPWTITIVLISIPVRIILSSIVSFVGLETVGEGVGKGVGLFISFFVGVFYISFFLTVILSPFLKNFIG